MLGKLNEKRWKCKVDTGKGHNVQSDIEEKQWTVKMSIKKNVKMLPSKIIIKSVTAREILGEFLGTFMLVLFNHAAIAQKVLTNGANGGDFPTYWGAGLAVMLGILVSGGISGGHINPAVTLAMAVWGKHPWSKVLLYMVAQYFGAFMASCILYGVYINALNHFEMTKSLTTARIWATYPGVMTDANGQLVPDFLSNGNGLVDQIIGTMLLLICVCAISDPMNMGVPKHLIPLYVGLAVVNLNNCFGFNCGAALNPARDLAPRVFTFIAGWGEQPFRASTQDGIRWWWVPIVAPHIGAIIGVGIYILFIELHYPERPHHPQHPHPPQDLHLPLVQKSDPKLQI